MGTWGSPSNVSSSFVSLSTEKHPAIQWLLELMPGPAAWTSNKKVPECRLPGLAPALLHLSLGDQSVHFASSLDNVVIYSIWRTRGLGGPPTLDRPFTFHLTVLRCAFSSTLGPPPPWMPLSLCFFLSHLLPTLSVPAIIDCHLPTVSLRALLHLQPPGHHQPLV